MFNISLVQIEILDVVKTKIKVQEQQLSKVIEIQKHVCFHLNYLIPQMMCQISFKLSCIVQKLTNFDISGEHPQILRPIFSGYV